MERKYKVGDRVVVTKERPDITAGFDYTVMDVTGGEVMVYDDLGGGHWIEVCDVQPYSGGQYTRILEAIAGTDAVTMARNIMEALK